MKNLLLFVGIFTSLFANAQELEKSLLWEISGEGLESPSYLYGTIHATCDATLDANTLKALDETKQLYLEIDMDDPNLQATMMKGMMMKDGVTMSSLMTEEEAKIVDTFIKENLSFSLKMIDNFKPFMVSSMLIPKLLECPMQSIETELVKISKEQKEEVYGLESITDQLTVFDKIPYKTQVEELIKTAKDNMVKDKAEFKKIITIYADKDIEGMLDLMDESENKISSDFNDVLLNDRNANWISVIEKASKEKPTFYGVGAGHLAGEKGVIKLLRKKGYRVEAVK